MRLFAVIAFLVPTLFAAAGGVALAAAPSPALLQGATPAPGLCPVSSETSGTSWVLNVTGADLSGVDAGLPPKCYSLTADLLIQAHQHSGWFMLYVESGSITFTVKEGIMWAHCTPDCGTGRPLGSADHETLLPGDIVTLMPGDWVLQDRATTHEFQNAVHGQSSRFYAAYGKSDLNGDGSCRGAC